MILLIGYGIVKYFNKNTTLIPTPTPTTNGWANIVFPQQMRNDSSGNGYYGASRGSRTHAGVDLLVDKNQSVYSPVDGLVTRSFNAYSDDNKYKGIEIETPEGVRIKIMYINPDFNLIGTQVTAGQQVATAQAINEKYSSTMLNHIHVEKWVNGVNVDITNDLNL